MSGSQYIALSGMRARARRARPARHRHRQRRHGRLQGRARVARRQPSVRRSTTTLQTAIDTTLGGRRLDIAAGAIAPTGRRSTSRSTGTGFFAVDTPAGPRYTRNGHFTLSADRQAASPRTARLVQGTDGADHARRRRQCASTPTARVWAARTRAGQLAIVDVRRPRPAASRPGHAAARRRPDARTPSDRPTVRGGLARAVERVGRGSAGRADDRARAASKRCRRPSRC